jgi:hypothetical protein
MHTPALLISRSSLVSDSLKYDAACIISSVLVTSSFRKDAEYPFSSSESTALRP